LNPEVRPKKFKRTGPALPQWYNELPPWTEKSSKNILAENSDIKSFEFTENKESKNLYRILRKKIMTNMNNKRCFFGTEPIDTKIIMYLFKSMIIENVFKANRFNKMRHALFIEPLEPELSARMLVELLTKCAADRLTPIFSNCSDTIKKSFEQYCCLRVNPDLGGWDVQPTRKDSRCDICGAKLKSHCQVTLSGHSYHSLTFNKIEDLNPILYFIGDKCCRESIEIFHHLSHFLQNFHTKIIEAFEKFTNTTTPVTDIDTVNAFITSNCNPDVNPILLYDQTGNLNLKIERAWAINPLLKNPENQDIEIHFPKLSTDY